MSPSPHPVSAHLMEGLTEGERAKAAELKAAVAAQVGADPAHALFCNEFTYVRYLRAREWNVVKAQKMLEETLKWREEFKPQTIKWSDIRKESETGKVWRMAQPDKLGRPVLVMRPANENTKESPEQVRNLVYHLERASAVADASKGDGKMTWLVDHNNFSLKTSPGIKHSLKIVHILQNHYPERLGLAVLYHSPTLFSATWKAIKPFVDPETQKKVEIFTKKQKDKPDRMAELFAMDGIESAFGGKIEGELFDVTAYEKMSTEEDELAAAALTQAAATTVAVA